jgi:hypothetical protein
LTAHTKGSTSGIGEFRGVHSVAEVRGILPMADEKDPDSKEYQMKEISFMMLFDNISKAVRLGSECQSEAIS